MQDISLIDGLKQMYTLTELDLSGNTLTQDMQESLQFWSLSQLLVLKLDKTGLTELPSSVGRLNRLEHLSMKDNKLTTLPITLGFCCSLKYLNLAHNRFTTLPGVILQLAALEEFRRLDNPLVKRSDNCNSWPHIHTSSSTPAPKKNPDSLQALSARAVMTTKIDYWEEEIPPLQCKMLDYLASQYNYCENCHRAISGKGIIKNKIRMLDAIMAVYFSLIEFIQIIYSDH